MHIVLKPRITRFAQLKPGDLFIFEHAAGTAAALTISDPTADGDKLSVVIGPTFPHDATGPTLYEPRQSTVASFGQEYALRLPSRPEDWRTTEPSETQPVIAINDKGDAFLRAGFRTDHGFRHCYVNLVKASIVSKHDGSAYIDPPGYCAYATTWEILTNEDEPRPILAFSRKT